MNASALAEAYAYLDNLPPPLYETVVTQQTTDLQGLVESVMTWRESLLEGGLPKLDAEVRPSWPESPVAEVVAGALDSLQLPRFCKGREDVTDEVLLMMLQLDREAPEALQRLLEDFVSNLEDEDEDGEDDSEDNSGGSAPGAVGPVESPSGDSELGGFEVVSSEFKEAEDAVKARQQTAKQFAKEVEAAIRAKWNDRLVRWQQVVEFLGEGIDPNGLGYDLTKSAFQWRGWRDALRIAEAIKKSPHLRDLIRRIGRLQDSQSAANSPVMEQVFEARTETKQERKEIPAPWAPQQVKGIERSDSITRMLPSEAVLLRRPILKMLWHARRAERALMAYRAEGTDFESVSVDHIVQVPVMRPKPLERGPLILCIDTSGSMAGIPETIAKAVVLEAMRTAHREKRKCLLHSFSGPGDWREHELTFDADGMKRMLKFLGYSFGGGTDLEHPLRRIGDRLLTDSAWKRADVLIVTDGGFALPELVDEQFKKARATCGARMFGVCTWSYASDEMNRLCSEVHLFENLK